MVSVLRKFANALVLTALCCSLCLPAIAADPSGEAPKPPSPANVLVERIPDSTVQFEMVRIPAGTLTVPDASDPAKTTAVAIKAFWLQKTETTWDEYDAFMFLQNADDGKSADAVSRPSKPYGAPDRGFGHKGYPVISVTCNAAQQYCKWLSALTGRKYRIPTEHEWEYACRAGATAIPEDKLSEYAWFWEEKTHPVGKKKANAWGLHDMLGNAGEWCIGRDGKPVLCGGTYQNTGKKVGPAARAHETPGWTASDPQTPKSTWWLSDGPFAGFRVLRED